MTVIDCDCHNFWSSSHVLVPYLKDWWRDCFLRGEQPGPKGAFPHSHRAWYHPEHYRRADINPSREEENFTLMRDRHLDPNGIDAAILNSDEPLELSTLGNGHYAQALASAYNDWVLDAWVAKDPRLFASIVVAPQDPPTAVAEIRRLGGHPRMVQVIASSCSARPYGDPFYHPIHEACAEAGLPFAFHFGGSGGINTSPHACGSPRYFAEHHTLQCQQAQTHVVSMLMNGVFEKFPSLRFVVMECGVSWAGPILWRLDSNWRALRKETPWVRRLPSEYFFEHIRFTTQPLEQPARIEQLWSCLEAMDGRRTLMFSSDYPHWDQDQIPSVRLPDGWDDDVFCNNALATYAKLRPHVSPGREVA